MVMRILDLQLQSAFDWIQMRTTFVTHILLLALTCLTAVGEPSRKNYRDITEDTRLVGICYSTWFNPVVRKGKPIYDIRTILSKNPNEPQWGPKHAFHFWAEPALGYYRSDDEAVIRQHMTWLADAKIDFLVLDNTNMTLSWNGAHAEQMVYQPFSTLLNTLLAMHKEGKATPHVVIWCYKSVLPDMKKRYFDQPAYQDLWLYWNEGQGSKPLVLIRDSLDTESRRHFTVRKMWGLQKSLAEREWSFLQPHPQKVGKQNAHVEHLSVSTALQRSYMTASDAIGRQGGRTFQRQWQRAFEIQPKFVTITWWNEWIAQRLVRNGQTAFVDNYTPEFSRDIEPMKGGHGNRYYQFMKSYIDAYKKGQSLPSGLLEATEVKQDALPDVGKPRR